MTPPPRPWEVTKPCRTCLSTQPDGDHDILYDCHGQGVYGPCGSWHCATCRRKP